MIYIYDYCSIISICYFLRSLERESVKVQFYSFQITQDNVCPVHANGLCGKLYLIKFPEFLKIVVSAEGQELKTQIFGRHGGSKP